VNRLGTLILADRPAPPGSPLVHVWSRAHTMDILAHRAPRSSQRTHGTVELAGIFARPRQTAKSANPAGDAGSGTTRRHPRDL